MVSSLHKAKPVTLLLRAKTAADLKKIADVEEALSRQVGWNVKLDKVWKDDKGEEWRTVSWPMKRQDIAAVAMFLRRGKKPNEPALLAAADVHKDKLTAQVQADKKLTKKAGQ